MRRRDPFRRVLVTGATGYIGRRLTGALLSRDAFVTVLTRNPEHAPAEWRTGLVRLRGGDLLNVATVAGVCTDIDTVFHLASYSEGPAEETADGHYRLSFEGTRALLEEAKRAGVSRFVYASSAKAMGEVTQGRADETTEARPTSAYGKAKLAAERLVSAAENRYAVEGCSIRLPMVYGANPKGNLMRMIGAIDHGRFPPLSETGNRRSMVHVDDVVQALLRAAEHPAASGQVYLVTDGQEYSTRRIYEAVCQALGRPVPKWTVPAAALRFAGVAGDAFVWMTGRTPPLTSATVEKLVGSASYSSDKIKRELGYKASRDLYMVLPEIIREYRAGSLGLLGNQSARGAHL